ncbi:MAG: hypothetical protein WAL76_12940, partial [Candidatus Sulfotelmatobacter sp.]
MLWTSDFWLRTLQNPEAFWAMATAIATVGLIAVANYQLRDLAKTSKSDFLYKLKKDFFTPEARGLVFLAENDLLKFKPGRIPYFEIATPDAETAKRMEDLGITTSSLSTGLVDDAVLGPLEDVGVLLERNLVSLDEAYEQFDSFVQICVENEAIAQYLACCREDEDDDDVYDNLQNLYEKLNVRGKSI